jgi:peptidoglycan/LPS O-acetylase OafA/YrhL
MRDIPSLTGLRGVAALWVMAFHVGKVADEAHAPWAAHLGLLGFGWTGVDLFFVLSGFILMWVHGADFRRPTKAALGRFVAARIVRVYPLSLAVLLLILLLAWADPSFVAWYKAQNADNFTLQAFARTACLATRWIAGGGGDWNEPTWSLSAEVVGYGAFPLLAWAMTRASPKVAAAVGVLSLATLAAFEILTGLAGTNAIDQIPALMRMGCGFIAGMAVCRARGAVGDRAPAWAASGSLGALLAIRLVCQARLGVLLAPAGFALLIFCLSFQLGALNGLLSSRIALFLGRISFPLYLIHLMPLLWLASHVRIGALPPLGTVAVISGYLAFCMMGAVLLHLLVERPLHRWARRGFPLSAARRVLAQAA